MKTKYQFHLLKCAVIKFKILGISDCNYIDVLQICVGFIYWTLILCTNLEYVLYIMHLMHLMESMEYIAIDAWCMNIPMEYFNVLNINIDVSVIREIS